MNLQKTLPVVSSIVIILVVAVLRERSKTLATIFAVMPINMPLALWVMVSSGPDNTSVLTTYVRSFMIGLNMEPSMMHHYGAYGFWAPSVGDTWFG